MRYWQSVRLCKTVKNPVSSTPYASNAILNRPKVTNVQLLLDLIRLTKWPSISVSNNYPLMDLMILLC